MCWASASAVYVTQAGAGSTNGTNLGNAFAVTALSSAGNCGAGATQIGADTVVHLNGTFTLTNGTTAFTLPSACGGTSGHPVILQFDAGALWTAGYFSPSGSIIITGLSNLTVEMTGSTIQNTTNGSPTATCLSGVACSTQSASLFIQALNCTNCEFSGGLIQDLYIHTKCEAASGCDTAADQTGINAIFFGGDGVLIHDITAHDIGWVFLENSGNATNQRLYNNVVYNMDHGIVCGANASGKTITNLFIYNNHFHDMANWDTGTADVYHHDYVHCFSAVGAKIQNLYLYNNLFDGNEGDCCVTAMVYLEGSTGPAWTDSTGTAYIWNNVFLGSIDVNNSNIYVAAGAGHQFLNNVLIVAAPGGGGCLGFYQSSTSVTVQNNVIEGCNAVINSSTATSFTSIDYNYYGHASGGSNIFSFASTHSNTFAGWQTACSCDAHSFAASPLSSTIANLSATGIPALGYLGIGTGLNLSASATGLMATLQNTTTAGGSALAVPRPSSAAWDIGAYQYVSGGGSSLGGNLTLGGSSVHN